MPFLRAFVCILCILCGRIQAADTLEIAPAVIPNIDATKYETPFFNLSDSAHVENWFMHREGPHIVFTFPHNSTSLTNLGEAIRHAVGSYLGKDETEAADKALAGAYYAPVASRVQTRDSIWMTGKLFKFRVSIWPNDVKLRINIEWLDPESDAARTYRVRYETAIAAADAALAAERQQKRLAASAEQGRQQAAEEAERTRAKFEADADAHGMSVPEYRRFLIAEDQRKKEEANAVAARAARQAEAVKNAPTYVLNDGSKILAVQIIDAQDLVTLKDPAGKLHTIPKHDIAEIIKP